MSPAKRGTEGGAKQVGSKADPFNAEITKRRHRKVHSRQTGEDIDGSVDRGDDASNVICRSRTGGVKYVGACFLITLQALDRVPPDQVGRGGSFQPGR